MAIHIHQWDEARFEITSKRRKGFPSKTQVKLGTPGGFVPLKNGSAPKRDGNDEAT